MTTQQPEALRLAEEIEYLGVDECDAAADELRRLHSVNAELLAALKLAAEINPYGSVENAAARDAARAAITNATRAA